MAIVEMPWLFEMTVASDAIDKRARYILQAFAGTLDEMDPMIYGWAWLLQDHLKDPELTIPEDPDPASDYMSSHGTALGVMKTLDLLAVLCDRPDWLPQIKKTIVQPKHLFNRWFQIGMNFFAFPVFPYNELIRSENLKEDLEKFFKGENPWDYVTGFDEWALLHHPWFKKLREAEGFEKWWNHWNHRDPFVDADPLFGAPNA